MITNNLQEFNLLGSTYIFGTYRSLTKINKNLLNKEFFSFFQYNKNSQENYPKIYSKNLDKHTKIDLGNYGKHFFLYPLTDEEKLPFKIGDEISFLSLFFDHLIDNNMVNPSIGILYSVKNHFWRFNNPANWENIQTLIKHREKMKFNPVGIIGVKPNRKSIKIITFDYFEYSKFRFGKVITLNMENSSHQTVNFQNHKKSDEFINLQKIKMKDLLLVLCPFEVKNKWIFFLWGEKDFEQSFSNKNPMKDAPIQNFVANLFENKGYKTFLEADIKKIGDQEIDINLNFDLLVYKGNILKCIEFKQKFDENLKEKESKFLKYLGRIFYLKELIEINHYELKIQGFFITTGKSPCNFNFNSNDLEIHIISNQNLDLLFSDFFLS